MVFTSCPASVTLTSFILWALKVGVSVCRALLQWLSLAWRIPRTSSLSICLRVSAGSNCQDEQEQQKTTDMALRLTQTDTHYMAQLHTPIHACTKISTCTCYQTASTIPWLSCSVCCFGSGYCRVVHVMLSMLKKITDLEEWPDRGRLK